MRVGVDGRSLDPAGGRGVAGYTRGMLRALAAAAPGVTWRVSLPRGTALPPALAAAPGVVAVQHLLPSRLLHGAGALVRRPRLEQLLGDVDVLWLPAPAPVATGVPLVLSVHDLAFEERPADFTAYERLWHRLGRLGALARQAARVAADTDATARAATGAWDLDPGRVAVVPAGPGEPGPAPAPERAAAIRARLGVDGGSRYFLFVGALEPRKGLDVLLAAHARARAGGLDAELVIAGEGRLADGLAGPGVRLAGRVDAEAKGALYAGALAVVLPSWVEGYGYPPLEGFAHGVPAIVSDIPALRETAGPGALHVAAGDERAWADALAVLAADPALRRELAAAGAGGLAERSWAAAADALLRLLREAAG